MVCVAIILAGSTRSLYSVPAAIVTGHSIDCNGWNFLVDSFDSSDPAASTNGRYDSAKAGDAGDVVAIDGITNSLPVGRALIYGHLYTGSNSPVIVGTNGGVGTHAWLAENSGIEPGFRLSSSNPAIPDASAPYNSGLAPGPGDVALPGGFTNHYDHVLDDGDYYAADLSGSTIVLGAARLVLPNGLQLIGSDGITIASTGALQLYCSGTNCVLSGNGVLNLNGLARSFVMYGSPTLTNVTLNLNSSFRGVVIAPNAAVEINGSGVNTIDISGSLMVASVALNGNLNFHFDRSLTEAATLRPLSISGAEFQFELGVVGFPGFNYTVQASTDLNSWTVLATNRSPFTFIDPGAGQLSRRFYRAIRSP